MAAAVGRDPCGRGFCEGCGKGMEGEGGQRLRPAPRRAVFFLARSRRWDLGTFWEEGRFFLGVLRAEEASRAAACLREGRGAVRAGPLRRVLGPSLVEASSWEEASSSGSLT